MLIDVRIICAHDALEQARSIMRLLTAQGHHVDLAYGRASLAQLDMSNARREAVLLIWSPHAPGAHYPLQWAQEADPTRLVEIALCKQWPPVPGRAEVIDFASWKGMRGGCWRTLEERLRGITKATEPPKPQPRLAAMALAGAGLIAAAGAIWARVEADRAPLGAPTLETAMTAPFNDVSAAASAAGDAVGGPTTLAEPESYDEAAPIRVRVLLPRTTMAQIHPVTPGGFVAPMEFEEPGFFERVFGREREER